MIDDSAPHLLCLGFGYVARHVADALQKMDWRVTGTSRNPDDSVGAASNLQQLVFDGETVRARLRSAVGAASHILCSIPPTERGDPVLAALREELARGGTDSSAAATPWIGYLSSTGVYGDHGGGWVDEESALVPTSKQGRLRREAENQWLALHREVGAAVHVFRLAGIYGPGRSALDAVTQGRATRIHKPDHVFSRIHVADIVQVLRASMQRPDPGRIYNVCDDEPAASADVNALAFELLGLPVPEAVPLAEADLSPGARSFYRDNRRVRNRRIKEELGVELLFPSYRQGLASLLGREG